MEKPVLFNTEMVQEIFDGRKTQTRRIIKIKYDNTHIEWRTDKYGTELVEMQNIVEGETWGKNPNGTTWHKIRGYRLLKCPYSVSDILWIRETWAIQSMSNFDKKIKFLYKAKPNEKLKEITLISDRYDDLIKYSNKNGWQPSIFMPREAARLFLKVISVRAERLHDITEMEARKEGCFLPSYKDDELIGDSITLFKIRWDDCYDNWKDNPWVWVIEFEKLNR